ncbi:protein RGF1 INDUCIBLE TRANSCRIPTION FACTOR 1-like [Telopea speciosissima]|uniref:protein RGF1 INDUCIBLE TRANSCRIPTION FACTOR 1-like n=1 Tax=Telopea speciosissima TaxID=54955 RepID=UPI001CC69EF3|nr:protein RGF1 INDUCIBLE TRANSCRIPTION FACTOR 1-like [Telopea speciosissima]
MVGYAISLKKKKKKAPEWVGPLLKSKFFGSCVIHQELRKNEKNLFCIDCNRCICQHCLSSSAHYLHVLLQIRRYVYHDVVRLHDMQKHIDCSKVQTYLINQAKVIFLNPRPQLKPSKTNSGAACEVCERSLQEPNRYCSVACKISGVAEKGRRDHPFMPFKIPEFDDFPMKENQDEDSVVESSEEKENCPPSSSPALKPKKQLRKRKGIPRRAPLC